MRKICKAAVVSLLSLTAVCSMATGCKSETPDTATDIEITFWRSGMGDEYIKEIVEEFEKKYPEYNVHFNSEATNTAIPDNIMNGAKYNSVDLYFEPMPSTALFQYLEPLDDVLTMVNEGESKSVSQKIKSSLLDNYRYYDGKYYTMPYGGGVCGITYNAELMKGFELPKTTDQLRNLVFDLYTKYNKQGIKPFIHFNGGYWEHAYNIWQAQYDGLDYYYNTFSTLGQDVSALGSSKEKPSLEVMKTKDGRYEALKVMETLLDSQYIAPGSNSGNHTTQQTKYLNGTAVMMCNGAWMSNEMKKSSAAKGNFSIMQTPVISAIVDKLTDVKNDSTLAAVIEVVDKVVDGEIAINDIKQSDGTYKIGEKTICASDWERIFEARNLIWENYSEHAICIPNYATAKEGAKKFVAFYYSDEAQKIMNNTTHITLPLNFDKAENEPNTESWLPFESTMAEFAKKYTTVGRVESRRSIMFSQGGLMEYGGVNFVNAMSQQSGAMSADAVWNSIMGTFDKNWNTYLSNAGLK